MTDETPAPLTFTTTDAELARALHHWRKTRSLAGCGWRFGSVVDGEVLCPCSVDARAILALVRPDGSGLCDVAMQNGWTCTRLPNHEGVHQ